MLFSEFAKATTTLGLSFCAGPINAFIYPKQTYEFGKGYVDNEDCEPEIVTLSGYICGLSVEEFDNSSAPSCVSKLVLINCQSLDFKCFSCFEITCGAFSGKKFQIFRKDGQEYITIDKMNHCVEIYVIEVPNA